MKNIVYTRGPLHRYYDIAYEYIGSDGTKISGVCEDKEEGLKMLEFFDKYKIPYKTVIYRQPKPGKSTF